MYFKDYSLCQWKLERFSWGIRYKDYKAYYPEVTNFADNFLDNGAGRSNFLFRYSRYLRDGSKANASEEYKIVEHFYPEARIYEPYGLTVKLISYDGQHSGVYGPQTKHINYTAIVDEKPQDE